MVITSTPKKMFDQSSIPLPNVRYSNQPAPVNIGNLYLLPKREILDLAKSSLKNCGVSLASTNPPSTPHRAQIR